MDYKKIYAIKAKNRERIKEICPDMDNISGIYFFYRVDNTGIKYGYIGQSITMLDRCAQHLEEYDHIALSIKKYGLYNDTNIYGYKLMVIEITDDLDNREQYWIHHYANLGYQLRNNTTGGQSGKSAMDTTIKKGYRQGVDTGYTKAINDINKLLDTGRITITATSSKKIDQNTVNKLYKILRRNND